MQVSQFCVRFLSERKNNSLNLCITKLLYVVVTCILPVYSFHLSWTWMSSHCVCPPSPALDLRGQEGGGLYIWHPSATAPAHLPGPWCTNQMSGYGPRRGVLRHRLFWRGYQGTDSSDLTWNFYPSTPIKELLSSSINFWGFSRWKVRFCCV